jgi:hypothetical protein
LKCVLLKRFEASALDPNVHSPPPLSDGCFAPIAAIVA